MRWSATSERAPGTHLAGGSRSTNSVRLFALGLVVLGAAAYANSLGGAFIFDDLPSIRDNLSIRQLWPLTAALHPPAEATVTGRPVLNLTLAFSYALSGTAPWGHHLVNVIVHLLAGLTLFGLVRRTLLLPQWSEELRGQATRLAGAAAVIWTVHPLTTEAVTYTIQRAESLMGLCYLLTLYGFVRARGAPRRSAQWDLLCVAACWLGMATKEVMVSAPVFVLLYDRIFICGSWREIGRSRWRLHAGLFMSWCLLGLLVAGTHGRGGTAGFGVGVTWWAYCKTQFPAIATYLRLAVWPHPLIFDYGTYWVARLSDVWAAVAVDVAALALVLWALARRPALGFLGLLFFAWLAPTSLVPGVSQMIVEHRMYLSTAVVVVAAVLLVSRVPACGWIFAAVALGGAFLTARRNHDYRTSISLWSDTVEKRPANRLARNILGADLQLAGRLPEALEQYRAAIGIDPGYSEAQANAGLVLLQLKRTADAIPYFRSAIRIDPSMAPAHQNLGDALMTEGVVAEALVEYRTGVLLRPLDPATHNNYANALLRTGQTEQATVEYRKALALNPDLADAHYNLGNALRAFGQTASAVAEYEAALKSNPDDAPTHNNLANTLTDLGRMTEAIAEYRKAVALDPNYVFAHYNLAAALEATGAKEAALLEYRTALRLKPDLKQATDAVSRISH